MDMLQAVLNIGLFIGTGLSLLAVVQCNARNETLEERIFALEDKNALFNEFFKKLDVKLPAKKKPKTPATVKPLKAKAVKVEANG